MVFNLYVVEGYKHKEIGQQLGITEATSRATLATARLAVGLRRFRFGRILRENALILRIMHGRLSLFRFLGDLDVVHFMVFETPAGIPAIER